MDARVKIFGAIIAVLCLIPLVMIVTQDKVDPCTCSDNEVKTEVVDQSFSAIDVVKMLSEKDFEIGNKLEAEEFDNLLVKMAEAGYIEFYVDSDYNKKYRFKKLVIKKNETEKQGKEPKSSVTTITLPHEIVKQLPEDLIESVPEEFVENLPPKGDSEEVNIDSELVEDDEGNLVAEESELVEQIEKYEKKKENGLVKIIKAPFRGLGKLFGGKKDKD